MNQLTVDEVEYLTFELARKLMEWNEPIPSFNSRFPNILESCLATPFQTIAGKDAYKGLLGKAAMLFYLMIKNHPFQNGNKRIAMTTLFYFLYKNKKWLRVGEWELYNFAKLIAESRPKFKDEKIKAEEKFLNTHLIKLN